MAKIECPKCKKLVPVIPPLYRCKNCGHQLNKAVEPTHIAPEESAEPEPTHVDKPSGGNDKIRINIGHGKERETPAPEPEAKAEPAADRPAYEEKKVKDGTPMKKDEAVAGWLIVHTEDRAPVSYDLFVGDNFFGTQAEGYDVDIPVEGDKYVSRSHAYIRITKDFLNRFHYELFDDGSRRPQGPSTNGTFINGNPERLAKDQRVYLQDGDTIQVGETKLVFKTVHSARDAEEAATSVLSSDYTATIILSDD